MFMVQIENSVLIENLETKISKGRKYFMFRYSLKLSLIFSVGMVFIGALLWKEDREFNRMIMKILLMLIIYFLSCYFILAPTEWNRLEKRYRELTTQKDDLV